MIKKWCVLLLLISLLTGCRQTKPADAIQLDDLPKVTVEIDGQSFKTARGSYCWNTGNMGMCADASGNPFDYESKAPPIEVASKEQIKLHFTEQPLSFSVEITKDDDHDFVADKAEFSAPENPGMYGYTVSTNWKQGDIVFHFILLVK